MTAPNLSGQPTYLNFDLIIQREGEGYVAKAQSPQGEGVARFTRPFNDLELENFMLSTSPGRSKMRRIDTPEVAAAKRFGERLYASAFGGEIGGLLRACLNDAYQGDTKLRVRLRLTDVPELADLPWEYLYNPALNRFFALDDDTTIVRYLEMPERVRPVGVQLPLRVLVLISDPNDYAKLDVEQEWINLHEALADLIQEGAVTLHLLKDATLSSLQQELQRNQFHIFHFIGHGGFDRQNQEGVLILKDEYGKGRMVSGQQLGWLLHNHRTLSLTIINACEGAKGDHNDAFAGTAQSLVQQGIPAVVAMQFEITDDAAKTFARAFYTGIASAKPLEIALTETRLAMFSMGHGLEWGTPVLYMRSPDGRIFSLEKRAIMESGTAGATPATPYAAMATITPTQEPRAVAQPDVAARYAMARSDYASGRWAQALEALRAIRREAGSYRDVDNMIFELERRLGVGSTPPAAQAPPIPTPQPSAPAPSQGSVSTQVPGPLQPPKAPPQAPASITPTQPTQAQPVQTAPQAPVYQPPQVYTPGPEATRQYTQTQQTGPVPQYRTPPPHAAAYPARPAPERKRVGKVFMVGGIVSGLLLLVVGLVLFLPTIGRNSDGDNAILSSDATATALAELVNIEETPEPEVTSEVVVDEEATVEAALEALAATATAEAEVGTSFGEPPRITIDEFKALYDDFSQPLTIIDVRFREDYDAGHISGAISIPEAEVDQLVDRIPRDEVVVAYCN
jgi:hypothetical protein